MEGDTGSLSLKYFILGNFTKTYFHRNTLLGPFLGPQKKPVQMRSPEM